MEQYQIKFLNMVSPIAVRQAAKHNGALFPSIAIAQAIQESGWGKTKRMIDANALYGVKVGKSAWKFGTAWKGAAYTSGTKEYYDGKNATKIVDSFRAYDSIEDATEDYMDMLCHCQRYKLALYRNTPAESIAAIVAGGYATGPDYARHIMDLVRQNNLTVFDSQTGTIKVSTWTVGKDYTTQQDLNVRRTPGGDLLLYDELSENAKKQAAFSGENGNAILKRGTKVTVKELKEDGQTIWLRIPSGWICGKNSKNIYVL